MGIVDQKTKNKALFAFSDDQVRAALSDVFEHYQIDAHTVEGKQDIANRLSKVANHEPPWSYLYVHNFLYNNLKSGRLFKQAIIQLAQIADGTPILLVQSHSVTVQALGNVRPGTLVYGDGRQCENPACQYWFIPRVHNQKYCSRDCGKTRKHK